MSEKLIFLSLIALFWQVTFTPVKTEEMPPPPSIVLVADIKVLERQLTSLMNQRTVYVLASLNPPPEKVVDKEILIKALMEQESNGNPNAIGDKGKAHGCLQIHKCAVIDVNRHFGTKYKHSDLLGNVSLSKEICRKYWQIYAPDNASPEELARLWNGGPDWRKDPDTIVYWRGVKAILHRMITADQEVGGFL